MVTLYHDLSTRDQPVQDELSVRILDAARDLFARFGPSRTTMDDVARAADVSRITVYRRFANKDELLEAAIRREFQRYFEQFEVDVADCATVEDRVAVGFASSLLHFRRTELIRTLMTAEPREFVASIIGEQGDTQAAVRTFVARRLKSEQAAGNIPQHVNTDLVAEIMVRLITSFLVTPTALVDLDDASALENIARLALVPLLQLDQTPSKGSRTRGR